MSEFVIREEDEEGTKMNLAQLEAVGVRMLEAANGRFLCSVCHRDYTNKGACVSHLQTHAGHTTCGVCGKTYNSMGDLKKHLKVHQGKTVCPVCSKVCNEDEVSLVFESREPYWPQQDPLASLESGLPPPPQQNEQSVQAIGMVVRGGRFHCLFCGKGYSDKSNCNTHIRSHLGETTCHMCNKTFARTENLRRHLQKHLGSIRCARCFRTYGSKYSLRSHLKMCLADKNSLPPN
ncbi:Hypothetical predicted protein [Cloeon dipterum]|uniref:C2H2-type domain-containing protein n=1 Tax=Cloeon dipterum TaxID=197152 RepID=A0A8S1C3F2_9INSE|nr:Hypothetical predicted protein [Cloeon dipterum]